MPPKIASKADSEDDVLVEWRYGGYFGTTNRISRKLIPEGSKPGDLITVQWGSGKLKAKLIQYYDAIGPVHETPYDDDEEEDDEDSSDECTSPNAQHTAGFHSTVTKTQRATSSQKTAASKPEIHEHLSELISLVKDVKDSQKLLDAKIDSLENKLDKLDKKHDDFDKYVTDKLKTMNESINNKCDLNTLTTEIKDTKSSAELGSGLSKQALETAKAVHNLLYRRLCLEQEITPLGTQFVQALAPSSQLVTPSLASTSAQPLVTPANASQHLVTSALTATQPTASTAGASELTTPMRAMPTTGVKRSATEVIDPRAEPAIPVASIPELTANLTQRESYDVRGAVARAQLSSMEQNDNDEVLLCSNPDIYFPKERYVKLVANYDNINHLALNLVRQVFIEAKLPFERYCYDGGCEKLAFSKDPTFIQLMKLVNYLYPTYKPKKHSFTEAARRFKEQSQVKE